MVTSAAERSDIDLSLLGPVRATVGGTEVAIGGPRQVAVLTRLMLSPNQVVSMDQLVDAVWHGDEPAQPQVAIRSYVSNLRRALEPNRRRRSTDSYLASAPPGYRLDVEPTVVDGVRFQHLIDGARDRSANGDVGTAIDDLRRALALWRCEPCSGLPESEVFLAHRVRLSGLRLGAMELLYELLLQRGDHDAVAAEIETAIVEEPERERLTELGMLALYRAGRQTDALALARRLRRRLRDTLGVDPSPSVESMELKILNHDPTLDIGPLPRRTDRLDPAPPIGSPIHLGDRTRSTPGISIPNPPAPPSRPTDEEPVVGREGELGRLSALSKALSADVGGAAAVIGQPGEGKSSLLRVLARRLERQGATVVWARALPGSSTPFWPWEQVVVSLLDRRQPAEVAELTRGLGLLAGLGPSVAALLPEPAPSRGLATAEITLALARLLERCARGGPLAIFVENLHWADRATVHALEYLVTSLVDVPVALVAAWRPTLPAECALDGPLRRISSLPAVVRVDLRPLDAAVVSDLAARAGRSLEPEEAAALHRRCGGNARLLTELLAGGGPRNGRPGDLSPSLRDAVVAQVVELGPKALGVLRAAALFRSPFTLDDLQAAQRPDGSRRGETIWTAEVVEAALRSGILAEADRRAGTYRFRSSVVAEVLEAVTGPTDLGANHRLIGHHLRNVDESEASHHLARSPEPADRVLGARLVLDQFNRGSRTLPLPELDQRVRAGLGAAEAQLRRDEADDVDGLVADALLFLSWRARVDDRVTDWYDNARRSLRAAVATSADDDRDQELAQDQEPLARLVVDLRGAVAPGQADHPTRRLERTILNLVGVTPVAAGASDPSNFVVTAGPLLDELRVAIEPLGDDNPAAVAARIHLAAMGPGVRSGAAGRARAVREIQGLLAAARRRLDDSGLATVLRVLIARTAEELRPEEVRLRLEELEECRPGPATDLAWARYGYPALAALGRIEHAAARAEAALVAADGGGDPLERVEAKLLWTRHLLWTGAVAEARTSIEETGTELRALHLPEPLPLVRQRAALALLGGDDTEPASLGAAQSLEPRAAGPGTDRVRGLDRGRGSAAEHAIGLALAGRLELAADRVEAQKERAEVGLLHPADLALLGLTSSVVGDEEGARLFLRPLAESPDRLIARPDGSLLLGLAGLWPALAELQAGSRRRGTKLLTAAVAGQSRAGSDLGPVMAIADRFGIGLPIDLQANLKPVGAH